MYTVRYGTRTAHAKDGSSWLGCPLVLLDVGIQYQVPITGMDMDRARQSLCCLL